MAVRNRVFPRFGLPTITSIATYQSQFTFPVRLYYERAGVTDEMFNDVAHAWMDEYMRGCGEVPLHIHAMEALQAFQTHGMEQVILSASQKDILESQLAQYGIRSYFKAVLGLGHIYATSKTDLGLSYIKREGIAPETCVLLGDTLHDAQVAREMGADCILIACGHQGEAQLQGAGVPVCASLEEAMMLVLGR